jgi:hypothetical protein
MAMNRKKNEPILSVSTRSLMVKKVRITIKLVIAASGIQGW